MSAIAYPPPFVRWLAVGVLFLLYVRSLADRYMIALVVEPIKADLGLSDLQISVLQGPAFAVLYCLFAIPVGLALDRFERRWVLFVCVAVWSLGVTVCGLAASFMLLALGRSLVGAGEAGYTTGAYSIIGDSFPPERLSLPMSIFVMGGVMGAGLAFLLGGPFVGAVLEGHVGSWSALASFEPWQRVFLITGVPGALMAFLVFLFPEPQRARPAAAATAGGAGYGEALRYLMARRKLFGSIFIGFGLVYSVTIALQLWLPSYFARVHGWPPARIGVVLGLTQIIAALSLPLHGLVVDRMFRAGRPDAHLRWCLITLAVAAPCAIGALLVPSGWAAAVLFGLYMGFILSTASMGPAATQLVTPTNFRGRVSALYVLVSGLIGMALGPFLVGLLTDRLFGDPGAVGHSLTLVVLGLLTPAALLLALGRADMRSAATE